MMTRAFAVALVLTAVACGGSPTKPTQDQTQPTPPPVPAPEPILHANIQISSNGTISCFTGLCVSFTTTVTNAGPGCATNLKVIARWYGSDGAEVLPNTPDIQMGAPGGLANQFIRMGDTILISAMAPFNDVRSAHTVYRLFGTWSDVACR